MNNSNNNNNENNSEQENYVMSLELENGETVDCSILTIFPVGKNDYIALMPIEGEAYENGDVYLYRYVELPNGEPSVDNILDDDEYEAVDDAFEELIDTYEFYKFLENDDE